MGDDLLRIPLWDWLLIVGDGGLGVALEEVLLGYDVGIGGISPRLHDRTVGGLLWVVHGILVV